jgi:hypothetical protein
MIHLTGANIQTAYLSILLHKTARCTLVVTLVLYTLKLPDSNTRAGTCCLLWDFNICYVSLSKRIQFESKPTLYLNSQSLQGKTHTPSCLQKQLVNYVGPTEEQSKFNLRTSRDT